MQMDMDMQQSYKEYSMALNGPRHVDLGFYANWI
jgi:hypothetical protein